MRNSDTRENRGGRKGPNLQHRELNGEAWLQETATSRQTAGKSWASVYRLSTALFSRGRRPLCGTSAQTESSISCQKLPQLCHCCYGVLLNPSLSTGEFENERLSGGRRNRPLQLSRGIIRTGTAVVHHSLEHPKTQWIPSRFRHGQKL